MENNLFNSSQLRHLYKDKDFVNYLSDYFSSYDTEILTIAGSMDSDYDKELWKVYIRILLANVNSVLTSIGKIEKNISFSYEEVKVKVSGGIKGRLLINEYVQNKSMIRMPREYPCEIKEKSFITPENEYLVFIIKSIVEKLDIFLELAKKEGIFGGDETEYKLLNDASMYFYALLHKHPFSTIYANIRNVNTVFGENKKILIHNRLSKGKVRNAIAYTQVFEWFDLYIQHGFSFIGEDNVDILVYDELFCNKLFELWNLYYIADTFQKSFGMQLVGRNKIKPGLKDYVYKLLAIDNSIVEIYYQKGAGLYWDEEHKSNWSYVGSGNLVGIPDISVKYCGDEDNLTIIDLKNRVRDAGQNSEEIYKIIGYFSNFGEYINARYNDKYKNQAVLIFRNDIAPFSEQLESNSGERMLSLSTGIGTDETVNKQQFEEICKYILDVQGYMGTKSQTITNCSKEMDEYQSKYDEAIKNGDEKEAEDVIYDIEQKNHSIVKDMFSVGDLKAALEQKCDELQINHFPHIWGDIDKDALQTLAMAECLFAGLVPCATADYAPVCLEYCRALEIQLNALIFTPFKNSVNISSLASSNWNYEKLINNRELTLGECIFVLEKCNAPHHATTELLNYIKSNVKYYQKLLSSCTDSLKQINVSVRRKAAHTTLMSYDELLDARQRVLGIGNINVMYTLLDKR